MKRFILVSLITKVNAKYIDEEIIALEREKEKLKRELARKRDEAATAMKIEAVVAEIGNLMQDFKSVVEVGTPAEKKEFIRLFVCISTAWMSPDSRRPGRWCF